MKMCPACVVIAASVVGVSAFAFLGGAGAAPATQAVSAIAASTPAVAEGAYTVDPVHSSVVFKVKHMNLADFYGRFNKVAGSFNLDQSGGAQSMNITIDAGSIDSNNSGRDKHLKDSDFFSASEFPTITFVGKEFKKAGEGYEVKGDLTLRGVTKPLTVNVTETGRMEGEGKKAAGLGATFTIKRSDFGMNYGVEKGALGDEVTVMVGLEGGQGGKGR